MTIYIYALKDPFTDEVRYIGKSIRPKERLVNQCNEHSNTYRCHWIQSVIAKGKRPVQIILEELPDNADWQPVEVKWIAEGRAKGWNLTNCTDGGDGVTNLSGESKERMLQTWKGRKHKPESLIKIGLASKGRVPSPEALRKQSEKLKGRIITAHARALISEGNKKLTMEQAIEIRQFLSEGVRQFELAEFYGVHKSTISNVYRDKFYLLPDAEAVPD